MKHYKMRTMVYDATDKTEEQVKQDLKAMGFDEHDIVIILKHLRAMDSNIEQGGETS